MSVLLLQIPQTSCECAFEHFGVHKMSRSQPHFNSAFEDNVIEYADFHRKLFCRCLAVHIELGNITISPGVGSDDLLQSCSICS